MAGQIILAVVVLLAVVLGGNQLIGPTIGKYSITDNAIELTLFGRLCIWRASFEDISEIRLISFVEMLFAPSLHLMNRPFAPYLLVRTRRGLFRTVIITPDQPREVIRLVQEQIERRGPTNK
jgi:hypothetical protein